MHGRKIELIVEDDGYQPPQTVAAARKLLDRDGVFCFLANLGTANTLAIEPILEKEGVPLVTPGTWASVVYDPPRKWIFGFPPSYRIQSWMMAYLITQDSNDDGPRVGVIYQDDELGRDGLRGLQEAAGHFGLEIVAEESYKRGAVDFSSQVLNLKRSAVTHLVLWTVLREAAAVLKEAYQQDWQPQFYGNHTFSGDDIVRLAGNAAQNLILLCLGSLHAQTKEMEFYRNLKHRYTPEHEGNLYHLFGFAAAQILVEALSRLDSPVTRPGLVEALESFDGWNNNAFRIPFTWGPEQRGGSGGQIYLGRVDVENERVVVSEEPIQFEMPTDRTSTGKTM